MSMQFLLDTNVCINIMHGKKMQLRDRLIKAGIENCYVSDITMAELFYGAECCKRPEEEMLLIEGFLSDIKILPITDSVQLFAHVKRQLELRGLPIEDFDILIGVTAVQHKMTMVTHNLKHFQRIPKIKIEDWESL